MCPRVVGECTGVIYFAHGNILYGRCREDIQRDQFIVRIRRGDGKSVQSGGAVPVAQTAHNQLSGTGDGDTGYLFYTFFHIADSFDTHFFGTEIFDCKGGFLPFHLQGSFTFQILFGHYGDFA